MSKAELSPEGKHVDSQSIVHRVRVEGCERQGLGNNSWEHLEPGKDPSQINSLGRDALWDSYHNVPCTVTDPLREDIIHRCSR